MISIAPLILIYVDDTLTAQLICAWIVAFFPILANTTLGLKSADHNLVDLYRLYGATRWQTLRHLRLPAAMPYFLGGLKIAGGLSLIGAIVAEFAAGTAGAGSGLAYRILEAGYRLNIPRMFAALILISITGILIFVFFPRCSPICCCANGMRARSRGNIEHAPLPQTMTRNPDLLIPATRVPACLIDGRDNEAGEVTVRHRDPGRQNRRHLRTGHHRQVEPARATGRDGVAGVRRSAHPSGQGAYLAAGGKSRRHVCGRPRCRARGSAGELVGGRRAPALRLRPPLRLRPRYRRDPHPHRQPAAAATTSPGRSFRSFAKNGRARSRFRASPS